MPSARDLTLEGLALATSPRLSAGHARRAVLLAEPLIGEPEFRWLTRSDLLGFEVAGTKQTRIASAAWNRHRRAVVGMTAPELDEGFVRHLALAERDVRLWRHARDQASKERAWLMACAHHEFGLSIRELGVRAELSPTRVAQLVRGAKLPRSRVEVPRDRAACVKRIRASHRELAEASRMLSEAEAVRRRRIQTALDQEDATLASVAYGVDASRARVHEIAAAGRERHAA